MKGLKGQVRWAAWGVALLVVIGLYAAVVGPQKRALLALAAEARALYEEGNENDEIIAAEPRILDERRRIHSDIVRLTGETAASTSSALLESVDRDSVRWGVRVVELIPDNQLRMPREREALHPQGAQIELRGGFLSLLRMLSGLSSSESLTEVDGVALSLSADSATRPILEARVDTRTYELVKGWETTTAHAASSVTR